MNQAPCRQCQQPRLLLLLCSAVLLGQLLVWLLTCTQQAGAASLTPLLTALEWTSTHTAAAAALKAQGPAFAARGPHCCCCPAVDKRLDEWVPEDRLQSLPDIQAMEVPLQSIPSL